MTLAIIYAPAIRTLTMYSLLYAITSTWSGFSLSFMSYTYGRSLSISSAYFHETHRQLTSLTSLAWHETRFKLITASQLLGTYACTHRIIMCHLHRKLGKPQTSSSIFIIFLFWQAGWHFVREQPAESLSRLPAKPGPQSWGQLLVHTADEREVQEDSGISNEPVYLGGVFSVPHSRFSVIKPYSGISFWSSLEVRHHLKQFDSVLSLRCWDDT